MTIEQRVDQLEKQNKRFKLALTVLAVALCGVVTMAATGSRDGHFNTVTASKVLIKNDADSVMVHIGSSKFGPSASGFIYIDNVYNKLAVAIDSQMGSNGMIRLFGGDHKYHNDEGATLTANVDGGTLKLEGIDLDSETGGLDVIRSVNLSATKNGPLLFISRGEKDSK